VAKNGEKN